MDNDLDKELSPLIFKELDSLKTSQHDLLQEKKRVWNQLELSIKELNKSKEIKNIPRKRAYLFNLSARNLLSFGSIFVTLFVFSLLKPNENNSTDKTKLVVSKINKTIETEYQLPNNNIVPSVVASIRQDESRELERFSSRVIKDFERQNEFLIKNDMPTSDLRVVLERDSFSNKDLVNLVYVNNNF